MRKKQYSYFRRPKTTAERKANDDPEIKNYVRGKRLPKTLPDTWDDQKLTYSKSWKDRRKTQYRPQKRGKKHTIEVGVGFWRHGLWELEDYFLEHDIPYQIKDKKRSRIETRTKKLMPVRTKAYWEIYHCGWTPYEWVECAPYHVTIIEHLGYYISWWSDKDIGIDYILRSIE